MSRRACALLLSLMALPSVAQAAARSVVLVGISGPGGERFADQLIDDLGEIYELIPGWRYREAAQRLGKRGATAEEVQAVAATLHADGIVGGAVVGVGRDRRLMMAVRDGVSGHVVARGRYDLGTTTLPLIKDHVVRDLVRALERTGPHSGAVAVDDAPPIEPDHGEATPSSDPTGTELAVEKTVHAETAAQGVFAGVGPSVMSRSLSFNVASAPGFGGGTVAGIRAEGAVFPVALSSELASNHPVLASFGLVGSYEHIFTFTSTGAGGSSQGAASHWMALLVGRIPLGHGAKGGTLSIESGYQQLDWSHQSELDARVPDVQYQAIDLGLGWDRPFGPRWLVGALRVAYLAVVDAGNITSGTQYGAATGWGIEAQVSLTAYPLKWMWLKLDARDSFIGLIFAQNGTRYARSSRDNWIGGALEIGFAL
jgi:hypothetical protein